MSRDVPRPECAAHEGPGQRDPAAGCGRMWPGVAGCGWVWLVLAGFGWVWLGVASFSWF